MIVVTPFDVSGYPHFCGDWWGSSATAVGTRHVLCSVHQDVEFALRIFVVSQSDPDNPDFAAAAAPGQFDQDHASFNKYRMTTIVVNSPVSVIYDPVMRHARPAVGQNPFDLMIVELTEELPGWHRCAADAGLHDEVVLAGRGRHSGQVPGNLSDVQPPGSWDYPGPPTFPEHVAYATNTIEDPNDFGQGYGLDIAFGFSLTSPSDGGAATEGVQAKNDSGGGVFTIAGGELILQGVTFGGAANIAYDYFPNCGVGAAYVLPAHLAWIADTVCKGVRRADRTYADACKADDQYAGSGPAYTTT